MLEIDEIGVSPSMLQAGVSALGSVDNTAACEELAHRIYAAMEAVRRTNDAHPFDKSSL